MPRLVLFGSSFRLDGSRGGAESPSISHAVRPDGTRTFCGRVNWATDEGESDMLPDCLRCSAGYAAQVARLIQLIEVHER